ncbi:25S rRNA (cytosine(2870)-C(5))-methyltransferase [Penicillium macrosclerotiorum]|uniref:25S rRNA (cytosine(2870)-C(5))-methyltransferase n=1 Tax=Penicillium macrosclerotiorum TaxID=303699 RepID=UPI00254765BC|nr:25S rRNA (cytosine(2870)-C(5))-methyltransferase [Penicillium macrosclerotiorum]KAJ5688852.1 25S rRNA (cytosine(2870)-C(5))-methyltransferase [Penicillium macrosclerotiorum]
MGKGRRMKKQGPPAPLDESKITILKKRKAAEAESAPKAVAAKKRRRSDADEEVVTKKDVSKKKKSNGATANGDEDMEELEDEFEDLDGVSDGSLDSQDLERLSDLEGDDDSVLDSDEEGHAREAMFSDDEDLSDAEEKLTAANIEGLSRKLDAARQLEEEEAEAELQDAAMQTNIAGDQPDVFADQTQQGLAPDLQLLRQRITDTIRILGDLKSLGQPDKSRAEYIDLLLNDICTYYGYTRFLAEKLFNLFTPMEAFAFFEANETPRPVVIRTNTLRTNRRSLAQALINRGVVLEPVGKWSKVGLQVFESPVPLGATPEYLAGHYILQAASSFLPVMALAPQPNERVLDMASAPGGKTTYMSALMRNTGCVIANDASKPRAKGLIGNIHRLGCKNTIVTHMDARTAFPKAMGGFDRVLLDAPCTGTGVISKDPGVKTSKDERDFLAIPHMQRQLLLAAIDSVDHSSKTGGYVVYSTCSVTVEENEAVVQYVLRKRPNVKIVDTGLGDFGSPGFISYMGKKFDAKMALTRRYFPHRENVDGFYVCKLKKTGPTPVAQSTDDAAASQDKPRRASSQGASTDDESYDKTPIVDEDGDGMDFEGGNFGPFEENEDADRIARAERNRLRRKGINPKAVLNKPKKTKGEAVTAKSADPAEAAKTEVEAEAPKKASKEDKVEKKTAKKDVKKEVKKDVKKDVKKEKKSPKKTSK